jgi:cell division protein FtsB
MKSLLVLLVVVVAFPVAAQTSYDIAELKRQLSLLSHKVQRLETEVRALEGEVRRLQNGGKIDVLELPELPELTDVPKRSELSEAQQLILECVRIRGNDDQICFDDPEKGIADFKE